MSTIARFSISALEYFPDLFFDLWLRSHFGGNPQVKFSKYWEFFRYRVFDSLIDRVFACVFGHKTTVLIMAIFVQVNCIEVEPALWRIRSYETKKDIKIPLLM